MGVLTSSPMAKEMKLSAQAGIFLELLLRNKWAGNPSRFSGFNTKGEDDELLDQGTSVHLLD